MKNQRGSLLIDILIGCLILSVALLSIGFAFQHSIRASSYVENYNGALRIAQQAAEALRVNDGTNSFTINIPDKITTGNMTYTVNVSTPAPVAGNANLLAVNITVSWGANNMTITNYYYLKP
jgi:Tfp pilus assembly protein PilV